MPLCLGPDAHQQLDADLLVVRRKLDNPVVRRDQLVGRISKILKSVTMRGQVIGLPYAAGKLLLRDWVWTWRSGAGVCWALFGEIERDLVSMTLYAAFTELVRFVADRRARVCHEKYVGQMREALTAYLRTRGHIDPPPPPVPNTIHALGELVYRVGSGKVWTVSESEDAVLQSFIGCPAVSSKRLINLSGNDNAPRILRRLRGKYEGDFAAAICCPGGRSQGGYRAHVVASSRSTVPGSGTYLAYPG